MVGGKDDRAARPARLIEDGPQVGDIADRPVPGAARAILVEGVIDRVEHHADDRVGVGDRVADTGGESLARLWGEVCLVEQPGLAPGPECGEAGPFLGLAADLSAPVSRLVLDMDVTEGTVARAGSRPSGRRPTSSQPPRPVSSSANSQPIAAVIPSSTMMTGGRCCARGRATRSSRFSTSSRPSVRTSTRSRPRACGRTPRRAGRGALSPRSTGSRTPAPARAPGRCQRGRRR